MDPFNLIQHFFSRMNCNFCHQPFDPDGIRLLREEQGVFVVSVYCHRCDQQVGVAMVGIDAAGVDAAGVEPSKFLDSTMPFEGRRIFKDPELTEAEVLRFESLPAITDDDVLDAHTFFQDLPASWLQQVPQAQREAIQKEIQLQYTGYITERPVAEVPPDHPLGDQSLHIPQ